MGGIPITTDGEVYRWADGAVQVVDGLFAAGECSCVSVTWCRSSGRQFSARRLPVRHTRWSDDGRTHRREPVDSPMADDSAHDMLTDAADQAADSRKAELDELLAGPIDDSDDGVPTANPYQLMAQLGSVMEQALAVRCTRSDHRYGVDPDPTVTSHRLPIPCGPIDKTAAFNQEVTAISGKSVI